MENCKGNKWTVPCHCICAEEKVESYNCCLQASAPHTGLTPVFWRSALWIIHIRAPLAHGIALMAVAVGCLLSVPSPPLVPQSSTYLGCSVCPAVACTGMTKMFWNLEFHAAPVKGHISVGSSLGELYNARWGTGSEKNYQVWIKLSLNENGEVRILHRSSQTPPQCRKEQRKKEKISCPLWDEEWKV